MFFFEKIKQQITNFPLLHLRNRTFLVGDIILTVIAVMVSFALRLDLGEAFVYYFPQALWMTALAVIIKPMVYRKLGLYRRLWAYAGTREIRPIVYAVGLSSLLLALGVILLTSVQLSFFPSMYRGFPRSVLLIDALVSLVLIGGFRYSARLLAESVTPLQQDPAMPKEQARRVLIVGAGEAGALVVREMQKNPRLNLKPVCFLDDDETKHHQQIHDVMVVGGIKDLQRAVDEFRVQEVIIAIPSAVGSVVRQVTDVCRRKRVKFRTMPSIYELIDGKVSVNRLREVEITDLLRRAPAVLDNIQIGRNLTGKRVLITGAGGSIGRELCRQIVHWRPECLIMLGHGENSIFKIWVELQETYGLSTGEAKSQFPFPLYPVIADVRDEARLNVVFAKHRPEVVFHVAAHKHVPLMEVNVEEAVTNNIIGTRNITNASLKHDVERLVMISSDKAIRPTSVMGATKRVAEQVVLDAANRYMRKFSVVRFGNVLGSRGSVIPHFKHQIAHGGPVTVTHPEMRRYFMTIPEAVHLILQAMALGSGGEVFVLRMGEQIRILDLAEDLIRLSGLEPYQDIDIVFTGIRPGEKLSEELWDANASHEPTSHPDIIRLTDQEFIGGEALECMVGDLVSLAAQGETEKILTLLDETIPGAMVRSAPAYDMFDFENNP